MKTGRIILFSLVALFAFGTVRAAETETDSEVEARKIALDLAGAFSNDGFKLRDGHWSGPIKPGETAVLAVNLYAGNEYWFSVGSDKEGKIVVGVYDEHGKPMAAEGYDAEDKSAAGFSPTISGQYFITIAPTESAVSAFCLVYSYK